MGDVYERVGARRPWGTGVQPVLRQAPADLFAEPEDKAGLSVLAELPVADLGVLNGVRLKFFTSASSAARSGESWAGDGVRVRLAQPLEAGPERLAVDDDGARAQLSERGQET